MSLILNFLTEISIIEGNPQTLPQIRIDHLSQSVRLIIICRLGTCVRSRPLYVKMDNAESFYNDLFSDQTDLFMTPVIIAAKSIVIANCFTQESLNPYSG
jgi:hypothetical protein